MKGLLKNTAIQFYHQKQLKLNVLFPYNQKTYNEFQTSVLLNLTGSLNIAGDTSFNEGDSFSKMKHLLNMLNSITFSSKNMLYYRPLTLHTLVFKDYLCWVKKNRNLEISGVEILDILAEFIFAIFF